MKAAYTKCVRAVWAADGGQRESAPPPTREWYESGLRGYFRFARDSGVGLSSRALVVLPDLEVREDHVRSFPRFITGLQQGFTSLSRKFIFRGTFHPCPSQREGWN